MLRLEMVTKKTKFLECMHANGWVPVQQETYMKNGAMLHYIKVLLWTPAECMQRGTIKSRKKRKSMSDSCSQIVLLPKDVGNLEIPTFYLLKCNFPSSYMSTLSTNLSTWCFFHPVDYPPNTHLVTVCQEVTF